MMAQIQSLKLKLCANLSTMFPECGPLLQRYDAAKLCGFGAVEVGFPYDISLSDLVAVKQNTGLQQILINSFPGNTANGELGLTAIPGREKDFEKSLALTFQYADALTCKKIHFLSGKLTEGMDRNDCFQTLEKNLISLLPELKQRGIIGLIEPINNFSVPGYILNDFDRAVSIINSINSPHIRLQLDVFHLQQIHGNLSRRITECLPIVGHVQVAQVPKRNEPDTSGEIDYRYIFKLLQDLGYDEWIGLEYLPSGDTVTGLNWIESYGQYLQKL